MLKRFNIAALLLLMLTATGGGLLVYHENHSPERQRIREMEEKNAELQAQVESEKRQKEEFKKFVQRLEASSPVAEIIVRDPVYSQSASGGVAGEYLVFTELDAAGKELNTREFWIEGKRAHIDAEVIKFDSRYVEAGDPLKGRSVILFHSIYDQTTSPNRAHALDTEGETPPMYRSQDPAIDGSQKQLWGEFWKLVDDPEYRKSMGVRVAQGEGVWRDFEFGYKYKLTTDANGGLNIINEKLPPGIINALKGHQHHDDATTTPTTNPATP